MDDGRDVVRERDVPGVLAVLLHNRRALLLVPFIAAVLTAIVVLLWPRTFTAEARYIPSTSATSGDALGASGLLGSIAANLNLGPASALTGSPQYFNALLVSTPILERAIWSRYQTAQSDTTVSLVEALGFRGEDDSAAVTAYAIKALRSRVLKQDIDVGTGISTLRVTTDDPVLSAELAARLLGSVDDFNLRIRRSNARNQREFVERRLAEAATRLRASEDSLRLFRLANRSFAGDPALQLENDRLERQVGIETQVYQALRQQYESARIEEVRDTPVLSIIQPPVPPGLPDRRYGLIKVLVAAVVAELVTLLLILAGDYWRALPDGDSRRYVEHQLAAGVRVIRRWRESRPSPPV